MSEQSWSKNQRDSAVELLRIFACLMVIAIHIRLDSFQADGQLDNSRLLISSFVGQAVAVFFLIMGFFVYNHKSFKKTLKKAVVSIVVPFVLYLVLEPVFRGYCQGEKTFFECVRDFHISGSNVFQMFVWSAGNISNGAHLWYIYTYMEIILFAPLIRYLCADGEKSRKLRRYFIGLGLVAKLLEDVQKVWCVEYGVVRLFNPLGMPIVITLIGYEIYRGGFTIKGSRKYRFGGLLAYLGGSIFTGVWQKYACYRGVTSGAVSWESVSAIISAAGLAVFVLSFTIERPIWKKIINFIAAHTYYIYLIHMLVITKLWSGGFREWTITNTVERYPGILGELLYMLLFGMAVFAVSLGVSVFIKMLVVLVKQMVIRLYGRVKNK